ncbi:lasso RiPP family leader peptide-containing protein [Bacillaceae bacterium SIJ1]|nr:lasso RiPP family leader peptide-containing protein [Litoribacterium kuwaitense]
MKWKKPIVTDLGSVKELTHRGSSGGTDRTTNGSRHGC